VKNPAIDGRAVNFAEAGADLAMIIGQADRAIALHPDLELVLVQAVDGDLQCPAGEADLTLFEERLTELLTLLTSGLPRARIFLVNQDPHAPRKEAEMLTIAERRQLGGTGPCAFLGPEGQIVPRELARLQHIIARYAERLASVCDAFERCEHHPQAFRFSADRELRAPDLNHASIKGLAHHAELAWRALLQTGLVPRPKQ
jgi:hypothetical protein